MSTEQLEDLQKRVAALEALEGRMRVVEALVQRLSFVQEQLPAVIGKALQEALPV